MISFLQKNHIIPQAIEQPLDMSVPENKLMLVIYLSTHEVENDRRALNTFHGMCRAKKEGRLMGIAPYGYINRSHEDGKKYIARKKPEASSIAWAFNEVARSRKVANEQKGRSFHVEKCICESYEKSGVLR